MKKQRVCYVPFLPDRSSCRAAVRASRARDLRRIVRYYCYVLGSTAAVAFLLRVLGFFK